MLLYLLALHFMMITKMLILIYSIVILVIFRNKTKKNYSDGYQLIPILVFRFWELNREMAQRARKFKKVKLHFWQF